MRWKNLGVPGMALAAISVLAFVWFAADRSAPPRVDPVATPQRATTVANGTPTAAASSPPAPTRVPESRKPASLVTSLETMPETHEEVLAMIEAQSGVASSEIARRIRARMPQWFDSDLVPLEPWPDVESEALDYFIAGQCGSSAESQREKFEYWVFDQSFESFIQAHTDETTAPERLDQLEAIAGDARPAFDDYIAEAQVAVTHKVNSGRFDRWPYISINETRRFTGTGESTTLSGMGGLGKGWVVQLDIYEGEYPTLDLASQHWREIRSSARQQLKAWKRGR